MQGENNLFHDGGLSRIPTAPGMEAVSFFPGWAFSQK
jgi:hypothetical protein